MTEQLMLSAFSRKTISMDEASRGFRRWNTVLLEWDVAFDDYVKEPGVKEGPVKRHVHIHLREALIKKYRKEHPGYVVEVTSSNRAQFFRVDDYIDHQEQYLKKDYRKAVDAFQNAVLMAQDWIMIGEARASLISAGKAGFQCHNCGWVCEDLERTEFKDTCLGCGKRYWKMRGDTDETKNNREPG